MKGTRRFLPCQSASFDLSSAISSGSPALPGQPIDLLLQRDDLVGLGPRQGDAARQAVAHGARQRQVGRRARDRIAGPGHALDRGGGEAPLDQVGQFEVVEEEVEIFLLCQNEAEFVLARPVRRALGARPAAARGVTRDGVTFEELLVARQQAFALPAGRGAPEARLAHPVERDPDLAALVEVLDAPLLAALAHGLLDERLGAAEEALAVRQALSSGIEASVDDMHGVSLR